MPDRAELEAEREAVEINRRVRATRAVTYMDETAVSDDRSTRDLHKRTQECVDAILKLTKASKNLKGTIKKASNEFAETLGEVLSVLYQRTTTEDTKTSAGGQ